MSDIERATGRDWKLAFGLSCATLAALIGADTHPLMQTWLLGASRETFIGSGALSMVQDGWPEIALAIALFAVALPLLRFGLLTAVLGSLALDRRPSWIRRAFRYATLLQPWAMPDVFLLGFVIAILRLKVSLVADLETGGVCLIAAGLLALFTRATLNKAEVWRAIAPDPWVGGAGIEGAVICQGCHRVATPAEARRPCPRCGVAPRRRKAYALITTLALTVAAAILYIPANVYPLATLPIGARSVSYSVLVGVIDLVNAKLVGLALIVFAASFAIPILKLAGLAWCVGSVYARSANHLRAKTRLYRVVEEIGRWSMVDPFVIACFAPAVSYNSFIYGRADLAAPFFTGVVVLTMIAARRFDPRLLWDAAGRTA